MIHPSRYSRLTPIATAAVSARTTTARQQQQQQQQHSVVAIVWKQLLQRLNNNHINQCSYFTTNIILNTAPTNTGRNTCITPGTFSTIHTHSTRRRNVFQQHQASPVVFLRRGSASNHSLDHNSSRIPVSIPRRIHNKTTVHISVDGLPTVESVAAAGPTAALSTTDISSNDAGSTVTHEPISTMKYLKAYSELGKLKLSSLVVATTAAGYIAAGPIPLEYGTTFLATIIGTSFCSMSASAYNQIYEISRDSKMKRTQLRPLVTGIITPNHATMVASVWGVCGTSMLWYCTDPITTGLGLSNIILYSCIYTSLKPRTVYNTWIGAIVGAIPPIMGYTAAKSIIMNTTVNTNNPSVAFDAISTTATTTTDLLAATPPTEFLVSALASDPIAISLASTLYLWQLPHFLALSYMYRIDYKRGGFMMVPTVVASSNIDDATISDKELSSTDTTVHTDTAGTRTANIIVRYAWYLSMVPIFSTAMDVTSSMYLFESIVLNTYALHVAYKFHHEQTNHNARKVFLTSLWYLPCTLMLFLLHSKTWDTNNTDAQTNKNVLAQFVLEQIHTVRNKGRELCIHEQAIVKNNSSKTTNATPGQEIDSDDTTLEASCPVMIVRNTDPNNIQINHHPVATAVMAGHTIMPPTSSSEEQM